MQFLDAAARARLIERYQGKGISQTLGYGTVRDYCDSVDHLPQISSLQHDMKDLQRPWMVKAVLACIPSGVRLLEIGGGEPIVAGLLAELGYHVVLVDPYDGSGSGPTDSERFVRDYSHVRIIRGLFNTRTSGLDTRSFDGIYSVSVLEHVHEPALQELFRGIEQFLRPGGWSIHAVDHVVQGKGSSFHQQQVQVILSHQAHVSGGKKEDVEPQFSALMAELVRDVDTYYLSAAAHNRWRGSLPYEEFPFRKCASIQTVARFGG